MVMKVCYYQVNKKQSTIMLTILKAQFPLDQEGLQVRMLLFMLMIMAKLQIMLIMSNHVLAKLI